MTFTKMHSELLRGIIKIFLMGSKPKVSWIYAFWVVAFMANEVRACFLIREDLIREPVSAHNSALDHDCPISVRVQIPEPLPTPCNIVLLHSLHQANPQVERATTLVPMNKSKRDTLYPPISFVGSCGHFGALTAATLTDIIFHGMTNKPVMANSQTNNVASITQT